MKNENGAAQAMESMKRREISGEVIVTWKFVCSFFQLGISDYII